MTHDEQQARKRLIMQRRLRTIGSYHKLPALDTPRMQALSSACVHLLGAEGVSDWDLRYLHALTSRGLFDTYERADRKIA